MKYNGEFNASELFKELDQIQPAKVHWTFTSPAAIPDRHAYLEEMLQQTKPYRGYTPDSFSTSDADTKPTSETTCDTSDQQPGHQIKCVNPHSYQHLMKKLPEERERFWNNI
jgi:hypothetical protein